MERIPELLAELFSLLDCVDSPLRIAEVILMALMVHRLGKSDTSGTFRTSVESDNPPATVSETVKEPERSDEGQTFKVAPEVTDKFFADLELLTRDPSSLSSEELSRLRAVTFYLDGN